MESDMMAKEWAIKPPINYITTKLMIIIPTMICFLKLFLLCFYSDLCTSDLFIFNERFNIYTPIFIEYI